MWKWSRQLRIKEAIDWRQTLESELRQHGVAFRWLPGAGVVVESGPLCGTSFDLWRLEQRARRWGPSAAASNIGTVAQLLGGGGPVRLQRVDVEATVLSREPQSSQSPCAFVNEQWLAAYDGTPRHERQLIALLPRGAVDRSPTDTVAVFSDASCGSIAHAPAGGTPDLRPWWKLEVVVDQIVVPEGTGDEVIDLVCGAAMVADERSKLGGVPAWIQERSTCGIDSDWELGLQLDLGEVGVRSASRAFVFLERRGGSRARFEVDVE